MRREIFLANFNSIKVQLELTKKLQKLSSFSNFNSIKVQLERLKLATSLSQSQFQFHKGTIRTIDIVHIYLPYP